MTRTSTYTGPIFGGAALLAHVAREAGDALDRQRHPVLGTLAPLPDRGWPVQPQIRVIEVTDQD